jgi:hypothetical protein
MQQGGQELKSAALRCAARMQVDVRALKQALWGALQHLQAQSAAPDAGCSLQARPACSLFTPTFEKLSQHVLYPHAFHKTPACRAIEEAIVAPGAGRH